MADTKTSFLWAVKQQESGGNYGIVNSGSGALGAYQVMPANIPSWTTQALGKTLTPQQFLADPTAQDRVAEKILGGYYDTYGARGAAAMWYSGQPDPNKSYGTPSVSDYVKSVVDRMTTSPPASDSVPINPEGTVTQTGLTDSLATGLAQGMTVAFKSVFGPTLLWLGWFTLATTGVSLMVIGTLIIANASKPVQEIKKLAAKGDSGEKKSDDSPDDSPSATQAVTSVAKKVATKKVAAKKTTARKRTPRKRAVKSEQVDFRTEEQATAQTSFGPAHPSYAATAPRATVRPVKKAVPAKRSASSTGMQRAGKRIQKRAKAKIRRKVTGRG